VGTFDRLFINTFTLAGVAGVLSTLAARRSHWYGELSTAARGTEPARIEP
jgi:hypothetical protein